MDWNDVERLRAPGFSVGRRGYDTREVDKYLAHLADWLETDAAEQVTEMSLKRKLELVGKSTSQILMTTQSEAESLRREAEHECAELRARAGQEAVQTVDAANERARATVEAAENRRAAIDAVVADLEARRDQVLGELARLGEGLTATLEEHGTHQPDPRRNAREKV
jgi:cell division septum initiation protein DivIVA